MWTIYYNNSNPFDSISPTPTVERSVSIGGTNAPQNTTDAFILRGIMTGDCDAGGDPNWDIGPLESDGGGGDVGFTSMFNKRDLLLTRLAPQFKNFYITTGTGAGDHVYSGDVAKITKVSFDENPNWNYVPFSVEVTLYDRSLFEGDDAIVDPSDNYSFSKGEDGFVTIDRTVSARGIVTSSSALANAANFVTALTGWSNSTPPTGELAFIDAPTGGDPVMLSTRTEIDRLNSTYTVTEQYRYDPCDFDNTGALVSGGCPLIRYSAEKDSGVNADTTITINGSIVGGINCSDAATLRQSYGQTDFHSVAQTFYNQTEAGDLYDIPIAQSINENTNQRTLNFSISFSDTTGDTGSYIRETFAITDDCENGTICVSVEGEIVTDQLCLLDPDAARLAATNKYNTYDARTSICQFYSGLGYTGYLEKHPQTKNFRWDATSMVLSFSELYCERSDNLPDCIESMEYTMNFTPKLPTFVETAGLNGSGCRVIQDMNSNKRAVYAIQGNASIAECCPMKKGVQILYNTINELSNNYFSGENKALLNHNIETGKAGQTKVVTFSASWSAEAEDVIPSGLLRCDPNLIVWNIGAY